jgi:hypothetical protein
VGVPSQPVLETSSLKPDVVDAGERPAALDARRGIAREVEDGQIDITVREEHAARA